MSTRSVQEFYHMPDAEGDEMGQPAAVIYTHSDGYPQGQAGMLYRLAYLEKLCAKGFEMYGSRQTDAQWVAAEYISQFRVASDAPRDRTSEWQYVGEGGFAGGHRHRGGIYVTSSVHNHGDIRYLYRIVCKPKWEVHVFRPKLAEGPGFKIESFEEIPKSELVEMERKEKAQVRAWKKERKAVR